MAASTHPQHQTVEYGDPVVAVIPEQASPLASVSLMVQKPHNEQILQLLEHCDVDLVTHVFP